MRSDKPYRRGWCTECLNTWQRERRAIQNAEAAEWRVRTRQGSKGGRRAAERRLASEQAPVAKARYIREPISRHSTESACRNMRSCSVGRAASVRSALNENPDLFDRAKEYVICFK